MMLLHAGRASGKTTQAMAWLSNGAPVPFSYPGWTRVLVVCHFMEFERLKEEWWARLEDFDHRVYSYTEWIQAVNVDPSTEVCIDNLDLLLGFADLRVPGRIVAATITAEKWETQAFRERAQLVDD